jgi:hypothetical protein
MTNRGGGGGGGPRKAGRNFFLFFHVAAYFFFLASMASLRLDKMDVTAEAERTNKSQAGAICHPK